MSEIALMAVDPGPTESGIVWGVGRDGLVYPDGSGTVQNAECLGLIEQHRDRVLLVEKVVQYGRGFGAPLIDTAIQIGRCIERHGGGKPIYLIAHSTVISVLAVGSRTDAAVWSALVDRYGGRDRAVGGGQCPRCKGRGGMGKAALLTCACGGTGYRLPPGPLHGVRQHARSALALAVAWLTLSAEGRELYRYGAQAPISDTT